MTDIAMEVRRQVERADTPVNSGYGDEYPRPEWEPSTAYSFWQQEQAARQRHDRLKVSVEKMMGRPTVDECVVAHFDHDTESDTPPVVQYLDSLQAEAFDASVQVWLHGGQAAVKAYQEQMPA